MSALPATFHEDRLTGIGGSEAAAVLGLSEWATPLDVYLRKKGLAPPSVDTPATLWGRLLEPVVRQHYAERTGYVVTQPTAMLRHPKYGFVIAHPDGLVPDARRGYEGKTARTDHGWGPSGTDEIPQDYLLQVQHYMIPGLLPVMIEVFDVSVLIGGQDYRQYEIPADRELQEMIVDAEHALWQRVQRGEPPEPDWEHPATAGALRKLYPGTDGTTVQATASDDAWRRVMAESSTYAAAYEKEAETAKSHLLWRMGDAAVLKFADGKSLRRKETKRKGYVVEDMTYIDARLVNTKE